MNRQCDIAIVGGGLAGASLAVALAPLGYDIAVVEAVTFAASEQPSYDDRTLAMSHSSCRILDGIGMWDALKTDATPIRKIYIRELGRPTEVVLDAAEMGLAAYGHVVEARRFGVAVMQRLPEIANVSLISPAKLTNLELGETHNRLSFAMPAGEETLEARLVVAADGANSFVRNHLNIPTVTRDYGQTAVICNITPELAHQGQAFECLTQTGPFAILPHTGKRCGLVWSTSGEHANELIEMDEAAFLSIAQDRFGDRLGKFLKLGRRSAYPLKLTRAEEDVRQRLVLLGNAAHAIHPVGAQGFNLALRDVAVLAELLADSGDDPGEAGLLNTYSRWRRADQRGTIANSDGMTRLFASPSMLAAAVRASGLVAHAILPSLRRRSAIKAMGYRGRVPRLALGERLIMS